MNGCGGGVGKRPSSVCETVRPAAAAPAKRALLLAPGRDLLARLGERQKADRKPLGDVGALPPAGERREIMRRDAGDRGRRIGRGRQELHALAFEPQHPHACDAGAGHPVTETLRHGAEVLANDHALGALAFERDMADEVVKRIGRGRRLPPGGRPRE